MTNEERKRRHITGNNSCTVCFASVEDTNHLLRTCPSAVTIWSAVVKKEKLQDFLEMETSSWLSLNLGKAQEFVGAVEHWDIMFGAIVWNIWLHRNSIAFDTPLEDRRTVLERSRHLWPDMRTGRARRGIIRNHEGAWMMGFTKFVGAVEHWDIMFGAVVWNIHFALWFTSFSGRNRTRNHTRLFTPLLSLRGSLPPWPKVSDNAKDLVKKMLNPNPKRRLTAQQFLEGSLGETVKAMLKQFSVMNKLKKRALGVEEVAGIKEGFQVMDASSRGKINIDQLRGDFNGDGYLDYGEFIAISELRDELADDLETNSEEVISAIMRDVDTDKDGRINYDEFVALMKAGTDWRKASRQYSRERFNKLGHKLMKDGSLQLHLVAKGSLLSLINRMIMFYMMLLASMTVDSFVPFLLQCLLTIVDTAETGKHARVIPGSKFILKFPPFTTMKTVIDAYLGGIATTSSNTNMSNSQGRGVVLLRCFELNRRRDSTIDATSTLAFYPSFNVILPIPTEMPSTCNNTYDSYHSQHHDQGFDSLTLGGALNTSTY
ncbi:Calcium-dependent protein kinase 7 [Hibiscus syriacus]|uniref:non-specific serine/threonine protein kinase n=1 Tax=Hibiscus syriacus TaxID=106335 RepID=A0A6A2YMU3_HIBSY|nr:Calcium-dependent protein kinase 7 [Hibiscus syriacus]